MSLENKTIEKVEDYSYLGRTISLKGGMEKDRYKKGKSLGEFLSTEGDMSVKAKVKIMESTGAIPK